MPPKTIRTALAEMLEDLSKKDLEKFCHQLLDRREEPRVRRNRVEGKSFLDIVDVLVSTFTERVALQVAVDILTQIDCNEAARALGEMAVGYKKSCTVMQLQKKDVIRLQLHLVKKKGGGLFSRITILRCISFSLKIHLEDNFFVLQNTPALILLIGIFFLLFHLHIPY
uniref:Pyrin domain-containing protein n=1 Tax=Dicentrarchus labrax TaxID=13489 RepID=A0A8C4DGC6_DICLA